MQEQFFEGQYLAEVVRINLINTIAIKCTSGLRDSRNFYCVDQLTRIQYLAKACLKVRVSDDA